MSTFAMANSNILTAAGWFLFLAVLAIMAQWPRAPDVELIP